MAAPAAIPPQAAVPPQAAIPPQAAMPPSATPQFGPSSTSGKVNPQTIVKAQKQARIAVSSLGFDDVDSAGTLSYPRNKEETHEFFAKVIALRRQTTQSYGHIYIYMYI